MTTQTRIDLIIIIIIIIKRHHHHRHRHHHFAINIFLTRQSGRFAGIRKPDVVLGSTFTRMMMMMMMMTTTIMMTMTMTIMTMLMMMMMMLLIDIIKLSVKRHLFRHRSIQNGRSPSTCKEVFELVTK